MADEKLIASANQVYKTVCGALETREWHFERDDENLIVCFGVNGEDIPIQIIIGVDIDRQLIRLMSPLPFKMSEDKRVDGAIAVCAATYGMVDGCFDCDFSDGTVCFRMTAAFHDSQIGEGMIHYMIECACAMVDEYNEQFLAINKGLMSISDFIAKRQ